MDRLSHIADGVEWERDAHQENALGRIYRNRLAATQDPPWVEQHPYYDEYEATKRHIEAIRMELDYINKLVIESLNSNNFDEKESQSLFVQQQNLERNLRTEQKKLMDLGEMIGFETAIRADRNPKYKE